MAEEIEEVFAEKLSGHLDRADRSRNEMPALVGSTDVSTLAIVHVRLSALACKHCDWDTALTHAYRARDIAENCGATQVHAEALNAIGAVYQSQGVFAEAVRFYSQILVLTTDPRSRGFALQNLGVVSSLEGNHEAAEACLRESARYFREAGCRRGEILSLIHGARVRIERRDNIGALASLEEARAQAKCCGAWDLIALAEMNMAEALLLADRSKEAKDRLYRSYWYFMQSNDVIHQVECLRIWGDIAHRRGHDATAAEFYRRAIAQANAIGLYHQVQIITKKLLARQNQLAWQKTEIVRNASPV